MRIKELEIDNFKSFSNQVNVPFLEGFTTISGPNGSGKSNIIDSILFALGLTTSRALRSDRGVGDLISTHNNRNEVYVKVTFDMSTPYSPQPDMSFARRVKKSSQGFSSTYYMNDKTCTLSQMHFELEKYNITPNSYNVIMQGDVTSITNCTPNERRKIIDEIAGVADFDRKIELATRELETVDDRVGKSVIVLGEIDIRLEQLKEERETALKYKKIKDEKTVLEGQVTTVKYFDTKRSLDLVHQNILDANKEKKKHEIELEKLVGGIEEFKVEYQKLCDKVREQGEDQQLEVKKQAEEKKGEIERKKNSINNSDRVILGNLKTVEGAKSGIENLSQNNEQTKDQIERKSLELKVYQEKLIREKDELSRILLEMSGVSQSADKHIERRSFLRKELETLKDSETELIKEKLPLENELSNLKKEMEQCNAEAEAIELASKTFNSNKDKLQMQVATLQQELEDFKMVQKSVFDDLDKTKNEISDNSYNIQLAYRKITEIESKKSALREFGLGAGVETIMASNLQGVHAPIMQLAEVEGDYADALSVALGGRSRFVVVENEDVASRAIELLKSQGKSRATFLPLNKIKSAPSKLTLPKEKGVVDFAINLIDFDDKYIDAFYFALGETLVVENMQCAKKLMGRYRIVTLDGEIFEKSGAITGGAKERKNVVFGSGEDKELKNYKDRLAAFEQEQENLEDKRKSLETKLDKIRLDFSNASNEYNSAKMELQNLVKNNENNEEAIEKKYTRVNEIAPQITKIEKRLDAFEQKHVDIGEKILSLQGEVEEVEKLIDDGELNKIKELTQGIEKQIKDTEAQIATFENEIDKQNNNIKFNNTIIEQRQSDIARLLGDNDSLEKDKAKFTIEVEELNKVLIVLEEKIVELGKNLVELQSERDKMQAELLEKERGKNTFENQIEKAAEQIESYKARRRELEPLLEIAQAELEEAGIDPKTIEPVDISIEEITSRIQRLQKRMDELGDVNMRALTDYEDVLSRQNELRARISTLNNEKLEIQNRMHGYEALKRETFLKTYTSVNENFKGIFEELSEGTGTLILENEHDPFAGGLTFEATQRDKKKQRLAGMSGGEKTLTALAFVFAVQKHMPAPFYAFDEVDMHLDGPNVEKLAKMLNNQSRDTQFVVISLRKPMIDSADRMIGVTQKEKGITKISGIKLKDEYEERVQQH